MYKSMLKTPDSITEDIMKISHIINSKGKPHFVEIFPDPFSKPNECFVNVQNKIKVFGGSIRYGWKVWEWKNVILELNFHSIWLSPSGLYVDLTPDEDDSKILFIEDPKIQYKGEVIDNIRIPLKDDILVADYIAVKNESAKVRTKNGRSKIIGQIIVDKNEILPLVAMELRLEEMLKNGADENSLCFCGKPNKYKDCCSYHKR